MTYRYEVPGIPDDGIVVCAEHKMDYEPWCPGCNLAFDITIGRHTHLNEPGA